MHCIAAYEEKSTLLSREKKYISVYENIATGKRCLFYFIVIKFRFLDLERKKYQKKKKERRKAMNFTDLKYPLLGCIEREMCNFGIILCSETVMGRDLTIVS